MFFKKKKKTISIRELSNRRPVVMSNMTAETIKRGVEENARRLRDPEFAAKKLEEELKTYR